MDPKVAYEDIIQTFMEYTDAWDEGKREECIKLMDELRSQLFDLSLWLSRGGFMHKTVY